MTVKSHGGPPGPPKFVMGRQALLAAVAARIGTRDDSSSEGPDDATETTFSTLVSPPIGEQDAALKKAPVLTHPASPSIGRPRRFRRVKSGAVDVTYALQKVFGKTGFKGKQKEIMEAAVKGQDILVVAPTGMGKSLCFQVPAVAEEHGLTLVVTPLVSLMADQIKNLRAYGVACAMLCAQTGRAEVASIEKDVASGHPRNRLLYITPERLTTSRFKTLLAKTYKQRELTRLVVDEAHCICEHGLSFRPDYQQLGLFREQFPHVPIMALTASAPPAMRQSIVDSLGMDERFLVKVVHPFNRPNIFYEIRYLSEEEDTPQTRSDDIFHFISKLYNRRSNPADGGSETDPRSRPVSGIIYARAKKTCDEVAAYLRKRGINAAAYHKGLTPNELSKAQHLWSNADELAAQGKARVDVIVATIAFGLGIDKPNTRFVIHFDLPKSMEGFYQETGRAGRDGHASRTVLYFSREDAVRIVNLVEREFAARVRKADHLNAPEPSQRGPQSIAALVTYCEDITTCRHVTLCRFFGEKVDRSDAERLCQRFCDVCKDPKRTRLRYARLSSMEAVQTQTQRLFREADAEEITGPEEGEEPAIGPIPRDEAEGEGAAAPPPPADEEDAFEEEIAPRRSQTSSDDGTALAETKGLPLQEPSAKSLGKRKAAEPESEEDGPTAFGDQDDDDDLPPEWQLSNRPYDQPPAKKPKPAEKPRDLAETFKKPALPQKTVGPPRVVKTLVASRTNLSSENFIARKAARSPDQTFKTPFADASRRNPETNPTRLAQPGKRSSSPSSSDAPCKIVLIPDTYTKPLPPDLRRKAVESLEKHLLRATTASNGSQRSASDEARIWEAVKLASADPEARRKVVLRAAIEIESDIFFLSATPQGYRDRFEARKEIVKSLGDENMWIDSLGEQSHDSDILAGFTAAARLHRAGVF